MSHNEITFGGILQPLVDRLTRTPQKRGKLSGQEVVIPRKDVGVIIAVDDENNIHLLVSPAPSDLDHLSKLDLKGLKIDVKDWAVAEKPAQSYLDIFCTTGSLPSFRRPFLRFAEDVLYEVSKSQTQPSDAVYKTCIRWRKFWSPDVKTEITREWIQGMFGELSFLSSLIERFGSGVVGSWSGPVGADHDFQSGTKLAVEVKTSTETPFRIICNIHQLDDSLFKTLFIACYRITATEKGRTLSELVREIEQLMGDDETALDVFYERLMAGGYTRQLESAYDNFRLETDDVVMFRVDNNFPKLTEKSFVRPPDHRISSIRYILELAGLKELSFNDVSGELNIFANEEK